MAELRIILGVIVFCFLFLVPRTVEILTRHRDESTIHIWIGRSLIVIYILIIVRHLGKKWIPEVAQCLKGIEFTLSTRLKIWLMFAAGLAALTTYIYCHHICDERLLNMSETMSFAHRIFNLSLSIGAVFVCASIFSAYFFKLFPNIITKLPTGMFSAAIFASVEPACACGSIPLVKAMINTGRIPFRSIITFIIVAPVLSPYTIVFSVELGWAYLLLRICGIFLIGMVAGVIIEKYIVNREYIDRLSSESMMCCVGCKGEMEYSDDVFIMSWNLIASLLPYFTIGIIIGGLVSDILPMFDVLEIIHSDILGLLVVTSFGLPMYLCGGQEIMLLMPFLFPPPGINPLPLGHALAFTFAGTGICIASIPLLYRVIGKKATIAVVCAFYFGSIVFALLVNFIQRLL